MLTFFNSLYPLNDYDDSLYSSSYVYFYEIINNNVNINGNNTGDINVGNSGRTATGSGTDEGNVGVGSSGGYGEGYDNGYNKQKVESFSCIMNNNKNNNNFGASNARDGNVTEPPTCEECFREFLTIE